MHDAFLAAIVAEPDEMLHRLVYADWLEEHGSTPLDAARAELIRVQIARETADPESDDFWELRANERAILAQHAAALAGPVGNVARGCRFRRGMVERIDLDAPSLVSQAEFLARHVPAPRVTLHGDVSGLTAASVAHLAGLNVLDCLGSELQPEAQQALASAGRWRSLRLNSTWWPMLIEALRTGQPLEQLAIEPLHHSFDGEATQLELPSPPALAELLAAPRPPALRSFGLVTDTVSRNGLAELLASPWCSGLDSLELMSSWDADGLTSLSNAPSARSLRRLVCHAGYDPSARGRSLGPHFSGLNRLVCHRFNSSAGSSIAAVADQLHELRLVSPELIALRNLFSPSRDWPRLRTLEYLTDSRNSLPWLPSLARCPRLRRLRLHRIPDDPAAFGPEPLPLAELQIDNRERGTSVLAIVRSPALVNLTSLVLASVHLESRRDVEFLLDRSWFPRLRYVRLGNANLVSIQRTKFDARFGEIDRHDLEQWLEN